MGRRAWSATYPLAAILSRACPASVTTPVFSTPLWVGSQRGITIALQTLFPTVSVLVRIRSVWLSTETPSTVAPFIDLVDDFHFRVGSGRTTKLQWPVQADWLQIEVVNPTAAGAITVGVYGSDRVDRLEFPGILNSPLAFMPLSVIGGGGGSAVVDFQQAVGVTEQQGPYSGLAVCQTATNGAGPWQVSVVANTAGGVARTVMTWKGDNAPGPLRFHVPPQICQLFLVNLGAADASFEANVWADRQ